MNKTQNTNTKQTQNIPQLRFPEFYGEWIEKKLGEIGEYIGGGTPDTSVIEYWQGDIPWVSSSDIFEDSIHKIVKTRFITKKAIEGSATKLVPKGSILMVSRVGIGKFAIADEELCTSQDFTNLITTENEYFLGYYFKSKSNRFVSLSQGTSIKGFTTKDIKSAKFSIPTKPEEQTKIANFLTTVDKRINLLQKKKAELEQYKKGVMQKLFSQSIRFKDDNGNDFPEWEEKKLGEVCEIIGGGTPDTTKKEYWNGEINWFTPTEIKQKYIKSSLRKISQLGIQKSSARLLSKGTLLFTSRATIGDVGISQEECTTNQGFQSFVPNNNYVTEFLYYWLKINKTAFIKKSSGSTFIEISKSEIQKMSINFPCKEEQQKIATFLSALDKKIEKTGQQIAASQQWKQGLLQKMFV